MAVLHFSSAEELEHQLSPSRWNKRMSADAVIKDHLTKTKNGNFESHVVRPLVYSTGHQYRRPHSCSDCQSGGHAPRHAQLPAC